MPKIFWGIIVCIGMLASCDNQTAMSDIRSMSGSWDKNDKLTFTLPELDSVQGYNVFIHVRNTNEYPYNNLHLIATINFPFGRTVVDTLEYRMANPDGSWLGSGIGSVKESKLWYKENVKFFESGTYSIDLTHAMRNNGEAEGVSELEGIADVGISIEAVNQE